MDWADAKQIIEDETYDRSKDLVFVPNARSLVAISKKYRTVIGESSAKTPVKYDIRILSAESGKLEDVLHLSTQEEPISIAAKPKGGTMVVASWKPAEKTTDTSIAWYSLGEKRWIWGDNWPGKFDAARWVHFTPDGLKVIVVGFKNILFYDAETGRRLETIDEPLKDYPLLSMSVRGNVLRAYP